MAAAPTMNPGIATNRNENSQAATAIDSVATATSVALRERRLAASTDCHHWSIDPRLYARSGTADAVPLSFQVRYRGGMSDDKPLKSAVELAMERLRRQDADAGVASVPLTDKQKAAIAEVRNFYEAKLAERDVLHHSKLRRVADLAERETIEQEYRRDRERLMSERDAKIDKLRRG